MEYVDLETGLTERLLDMTTNSYLLTQTKQTEKGINCANWFTKKNFLSRFQPITQST